ncbi:MAG: response regulator [Deltaproteobacteria bacterium]|nr:response regulator [Deltaproteobacteria bacterium]
MRPLEDASPDSTQSRPGLLLVDDDPRTLSALQRALAGQAYQIYVTSSPAEALAILERAAVGVVVADYQMPEMDGASLLDQVRDRYPDIQRILLTGQPELVSTLAIINRSQASRFLPKPWERDMLEATLASAFEQHRILRENHSLSALTERQNRDLRELNKSLEDRIQERTEQLHRAKREWERTFDAMSDPVAIVDARYQVQRANVAYGRAVGRSIRDVPGGRCHQSLADRDTPCPGCPLADALSGAPPRGADIEARSRTFNVWAYPVPELQGTAERTAVCAYRDVTEERTLTDQLARTQKLAALGLFVGGVAHEINNPLGSILAFTQLLQRTYRDRDEGLTETLADIEQSALRCRRIIKSLLSFAQRPEPLGGTHLDLLALVADAVRAFRRDYGGREDLSVECRMPESALKVKGDPALLHQLLRNLLQNAEDATRGRLGCVLVTVERRPASLRAGAASIEVTDNGAGIPAEDLPRIFDPFFSSKLEGEGSGLGLSICHRIVEQHGGVIEVQSEPGQGTTVRVLLPAIEV